MSAGQVIGLFTVGLGEYAVVWLGTDWDLEVKKGIMRNAQEAKRRDLQAVHTVMPAVQE